MGTATKRRWDYGPLRLMLRGAMGLSSAAEALAFGTAPPGLPPLFILGWPRAGTTLVYQAICHAFHVSFPTRACDKLPVAGAFATRITRVKGKGFHSDFRSSYGLAEQWDAPGECILWNQCFDKDTIYEKAESVPAASRGAVRRFVGQIERMGDGPFVNKNLRHGNRIGALAELFPEALFLIILRDPMQTATSLLRGRIEVLGDKDTWFSIKPRCYEHLRALPASGQIAGQLRGLWDDFASDIQAAGPARFAALDYGEFCASPRECLEGLRHFYLAHGAALEPRNIVPDRFESSRRVAGVEEQPCFQDLPEAIRQAFPEAWPLPLPCRRLQDWPPPTTSD